MVAAVGFVCLGAPSPNFVHDEPPTQFRSCGTKFLHAISTKGYFDNSMRKGKKIIMNIPTEFQRYCKLPIICLVNKTSLAIYGHGHHFQGSKGQGLQNFLGASP